jgi:hypothetical protein
MTLFAADTAHSFRWNIQLGGLKCSGPWLKNVVLGHSLELIDRDYAPVQT